jgi:hypothetical protein
MKIAVINLETNNGCLQIGMNGTMDGFMDV